MDGMPISTLTKQVNQQEVSDLVVDQGMAPCMSPQITKAPTLSNILIEMHKNL
jgi:hypothetical protein